MANFKISGESLALFETTGTDNPNGLTGGESAAKKPSMIEFTKSFKTGAGIFATLEEAQRAELTEVFLIRDMGHDADQRKEATARAENAADLVMAYKELVLDILTTTASSRPKARKSNGGKKTRKAKEDKEAADLKTALQE